MLKSYKKAVYAICEVVQLRPERDLSDETTPTRFTKKINKHIKYLTSFKSALVCMQAHLATLDDCQFQYDAIAKLASVGYGKDEHNFEYCKLDSFKISVGNPYDSNSLFICAVSRVQQKGEDVLGIEEAISIEPLKLTDEQSILPRMWWVRSLCLPLSSLIRSKRSSIKRGAA